MKKLLAVIILCFVLLSAVSCGDSETIDTSDLVHYYQLGIYYSLPSDFEGRNLPYGDLTYSNGDAYFFFNAFDESTLTEDMLLPPDITPKEYTETYILFLENKVDDPDFKIPYKYEDSTDSTLFEYVFDYDDGESESEYYKHMVIRGEAYFYHVTLSCYEDDIEKYEDLFDVIMNSVKVD